MALSAVEHAESGNQPTAGLPARIASVARTEETIACKLDGRFTGNQKNTCPVFEKQDGHFAYRRQPAVSSQ
jgi:hypothetical protein